MTLKNVGAMIVACVGAFGGAAHADTTYTFSWDHGETTWFKFASGEWIAQDLTTPDSWDADVDAFENLTFFDSSVATLHSTAQAFSGNTIKMRFTIEDVTGSYDSGLEIASFSITGHLTFSATGFFSEGQCKTSSFTISFSGNYNSGTLSSAATIPALSGSGNQGCNGHATGTGGVNDKFSLGSLGTYLYFNKFSIVPA